MLLCTRHFIAGLKLTSSLNQASLSTDLKIFTPKVLNITNLNLYLYLSLTPYSTVLLEKLTGSEASQEIPRIL